MERAEPAAVTQRADWYINVVVQIQDQLCFSRPWLLEFLDEDPL